MVSRVEIFYCGIYVVLCSVICFLFYDSWIPGLICSPVTVPLFYLYRRKMKKRRKFESMEKQFGKSLELMAGSMAAGTSFENAVKEIAYGKHTERMDEIQKMFLSMDRMIGLTCNAGDAFEIMAERSGSREIKCFSCALGAVLGSGGDIVFLMMANGEIIRKKYEAKEEMKNCIAEQKLSSKIMTVMPVILILMMRTLAPEYVSYLYTAPGRIVMTAVLLMCVAAFFTGEKIGNDFI